jgi:hypothetical protein
VTKSRNILPPRQAWTAAELQLLRQRYPSERTSDLAQTLGRPVAHVYARATHLGLRKNAVFQASDKSGRIFKGGTLGQVIFDRMDGRIEEHQAAVDHIAALLELVEHLVANLKGGFALPPTPVAHAAPRRQAVPATHARPIQQPPGYKEPAARKLHPAADGRRDGGRGNGRAMVLAHHRAQGLLGTADMLNALRISKGAFHVARNEQRIPQPQCYDRGMPFWTREQLAQCRIRGRSAAVPA